MCVSPPCAPAPALHPLPTAQVVDGELLKPWQLSREKYKQRKRVIGGREAATLQRLKAFQDKLHSQSGEEAGAGRSGGEGRARADERVRVWVDEVWGGGKVGV